jgi:hypothetical protein
MAEIENPIKASEARKILCLGVSAFSAIKRAMGIRGRRYVMLSKIKQWRHDNPDFRESDIYHNVSTCPCKNCEAKRAQPKRRTRKNQTLIQSAAG